MKKLSSKKIITAFVLVLAIFMSIVPLTAFTASAEDSSPEGFECCELSTTSNDTSEFELTNSIIDNEILHIESSKEEIIASIKSDSEFSLRGTVEKEGKKTDANEYFDFSSVSKFDIAAWASEENYISEAEKIDCYCDLYINRNFKNIHCLTSVVDQIAEYRDNNLLTAEMSNKINTVFKKPFENDTGLNNEMTSRDIPNLTNESIYSNEYFDVHYDSNITQTMAMSVAEQFKTFRENFETAGYNVPLLESGKTKYQVYLESDYKFNDDETADTDFTGACYPNYTVGNKSASYIVIYQFRNINNNYVSKLSTRMIEIICHEYFHAIQLAYNKYINWFSESTAQWAILIFTGQANYVTPYVKQFIKGNSFLTNTAYQYGSVVFPLTIQRDCGGTTTIKKIYEALENLSSSLSENQFEAAITNGIVAAGYNESFNSIYRKMASYIYDTSVWFGSVYSGASNWGDVESRNELLERSESFTSSSVLPSLASDYITFAIPEDFDGDVKIESTFSNSNGKMQTYRISNTNSHNIQYPTTNSTGDSTYIQTDLQNYKTFAVILSNVDDYTVGYHIKVTLMPSSETVSLGENTRYFERSIYLQEGECAEFEVSFATSGTKIIQTFGDTDTVVDIYDSYGNLLENGDDSGYEYNAFINLDAVANVTYLIKVYFYFEDDIGQTKLAITPADGMYNPEYSILDGFTFSYYEDIYPITNSTDVAMTMVIKPNLTTLITYETNVSGIYTFKITSAGVDTYMYIINPTSSEILSFNVDYQDDNYDGVNPILSIALESGIPYLVVISEYDPSCLQSNENVTLHIKLNN